MQYILNKGVFPSPRDTHGVTPLQLACLKGHPTCVCALLEGGADPHMTDVDGDSALHWAGQGGNEKVPTSDTANEKCAQGWQYYQTQPIAKMSNLLQSVQNT
jgi:ankyrin repeat protein